MSVWTMQEDISQSMANGLWHETRLANLSEDEETISCSSLEMKHSDVPIQFSSVLSKLDIQECDTAQKVQQQCVFQL